MPHHRAFASFYILELNTREPDAVLTSTNTCSNHSTHNMARKNPNIILTGTPGVGKTTHAEQLARATGLKHVSVNQIVKDEGFHEGKDEETGSWIVDEDKVRYSFSSNFLLFPSRLDTRFTDAQPPATAPRLLGRTKHRLRRRLHPRLARL